MMYKAICQWMQREYMPLHTEEMMIALTKPACCNPTTLAYVEDNFDVGDGYGYAGYTETEIEPIPSFLIYHDKKPTRRVGGMVFRFETPGGSTFEALLIASWTDHIVLVCLPKEHIGHWLNFEEECLRVASSAMSYRDRVYIVGGTDIAFDAATRWEDICLPTGLKENILQDVDAFFQKGAAIYTRLGLKPFRKLMLAGVPGTGKTMICAALARWALDQGCFVVYVSGSNVFGSQFWKIHQALDMAAKAYSPTIVIVEELDAYLQGDSKAQMLNVLDGSETPMNPHGTLLVATTNHPEKIDNRVMKRPGRLDRIFIIPELTNEEDAETMLRKYLGDSWQDEHRVIVPALVGHPGAFVREVALHALTTAAYELREDLPVEILQHSLDSLVEQIKAKDDFLTSNKQRPMGLTARNGKNN
ncbi:MAG: hypothetical protein OHK0046_42510 [Anaerolineae bacterium]